ncbi:hypothetical protein Gohar_025548 [Gossypium harknessii]|uniref:Pectinesterase inhibitor domain-containing protein n=1 Tax=Gossypium harknessii TaxID=34285 RepID=A0A7J9IDZ6_9ROSI|nr:hypothetical protein [Gossypium harknessii]
MSLEVTVFWVLVSYVLAVAEPSYGSKESIDTRYEIVVISTTCLHIVCEIPAYPIVFQVVQRAQYCFEVIQVRYELVQISEARSGWMLVEISSHYLSVILVSELHGVGLGLGNDRVSPFRMPIRPETQLNLGILGKGFDFRDFRLGFLSLEILGIAHTTLLITFKANKSTSRLKKKVTKTHHLKPRVTFTMVDCIELVDNSIDELQKSIGEIVRIKRSNFVLIMSNIQTSVSTDLTDKDTCVDGFLSRAMNGYAKMMVRKQIIKITHLTSNALALINNYVSSQIRY